MTNTKDVYTHRFHARAMKKERNSKPLICNARGYDIRSVCTWLVVNVMNIVLVMTDERKEQISLNWLRGTLHNQGVHLGKFEATSSFYSVQRPTLFVIAL